jgi:hypothetical protein
MMSLCTSTFSAYGFDSVNYYWSGVSSDLGKQLPRAGVPDIRIHSDLQTLANISGDRIPMCCVLSDIAGAMALIGMAKDIRHAYTIFEDFKAIWSRRRRYGWGRALSKSS